MMIRMNVFGLAVDPFTNVPIVILKDKDEKNALPVWIGALEASAIASELEKVQFSRPMTHDLLREILKAVDVTVNKIEISDLKDNVYYAIVHMESKSGSIKLDARPSDAIAIALRAGAPIFVDSIVLEKSKTVDAKSSSGGKEKNQKDFTELLEEMTPGDFGKYKM